MEIVWTVFEKIEVFIERSGEKTSRLHKLLPTAKREKGEKNKDDLSLCYEGMY